MIDATIELLHEQPIDRITVRDVAERAGHHHRFVAAWFGGKAGLFRAVFDHLIRSLPPAGEAVTESGDLHPDVELIVHLLNWLVANDPDGFADRTETPLIDGMAAMYADLGLEPDEARLFAQVLIAAGAGLVLFRDVLDVEDGGLRRMYELQLAMVAALTDQRRTSGTGGDAVG